MSKNGQAGILDCDGVPVDSEPLRLGKVDLEGFCGQRVMINARSVQDTVDGP